jgi:hypothetical protein
VALERAREDLYARRLTKVEATDYLASVLRRLAETGFEIRTDGPVAAPPDRFDDVMRHVEAGCFIYSGSGWTSRGTAIFYLAGPPQQSAILARSAQAEPFSGTSRS